MNRKNRARSSSLFLLELIIAILFFSISSAVCVEFFVKSHTISQQATELNFATNECSSIAEIIQASDSEKEIISMIKSVYPTANVNNEREASSLDIFFNENFKGLNPGSSTPSFQVHVYMTNNEGLIYSIITAEKINSNSINSKKTKKNEIYELEVKHNAK